MTSNLMFSLSARLAVCGDFVRPNVVLADVGTDHGYLPVWLVLSGKIKTAIALDINRGPLERCKLTVEKYNMQNHITIKLSDGLKELNSTDADDIVVAGMGGELIIKILSDCSWAKDSKKHFILQPMSKAELLRQYLYTNGFEINTEKAIFCEGKIYSVICASFCNNPIIPTLYMQYMGNLKPCGSADNILYTQKIIKYLKNKAKGLFLSDKKEEAKEYYSLIKRLTVKED